MSRTESTGVTGAHEARKYVAKDMQKTNQDTHASDSAIMRTMQVKSGNRLQKTYLTCLRERVGDDALPVLHDPPCLIHEAGRVYRFQHI